MPIIRCFLIELVLTIFVKEYYHTIMIIKESAFLFVKTVTLCRHIISLQTILVQRDIFSLKDNIIMYG